MAKKDNSEVILCPFCDFSNGDVGKTINTNGDDFVMIEDEDGVTLAADDKHFRMIKINYCPICGRKFEQE